MSWELQSKISAKVRFWLKAEFEEEDITSIIAGKSFSLLVSTPMDKNPSQRERRFTISVAVAHHDEHSGSYDVKKTVTGYI